MKKILEEETPTGNENIDAVESGSEKSTEISTDMASLSTKLFEGYVTLTRFANKYDTKGDVDLIKNSKSVEDIINSILKLYDKIPVLDQYKEIRESFKIAIQAYLKWYGIWKSFNEKAGKKLDEADLAAQLKEFILNQFEGLAEKINK